MRRLFLLALLALLGAVGLIALIESDPGYVLISYGLTTVETSIWVGLVLLLLFNLIAYAALRLWRRLLSSGGTLTSWMGGRQEARGRTLTNRGLFNYIEGNWARSSRSLVQAAPHAELPELNYLIAARASHSLGDYDKTEQYLGAAEDASAKGGHAVGLTRAQLLIEAGQLQAAVDVLEPLSGGGSKNTLRLKLLLQAYQGLAQWHKLVQLLPLLKKNKLLEGTELEALERHAYGALLSVAADRRDQAELDKVWVSCPAELHKQAPLVAIYVRGLLDCGANVPAEKQLVQTLKKHWDVQLVNLYGLIESGDTMRRQKLAEGWLKQHPEDGDLLRCLGRLALRNQLWGQAREFFESSQRLQPSAETCAELARLLFNLGEREQSAQRYREGLLLRENSLPDLPQPTPKKPA